MTIDEKRAQFASMFKGKTFDRQIVERIGALTIAKTLEDSSDPETERDVLEYRLKSSLDLIEEGAESPIEEQMGLALFACLFTESPFLCVVPPLRYVYDLLAGKFNPELSIDHTIAFAKNMWFRNVEYWLIPNHWLDKQIRSDFVLTDAPRRYLKAMNAGKEKLPKPKSIAIECDSFKWHGDKDAFAKDKKRERKLTDLGYPVYRFSGREINENPTKVAIEIIDAAIKHLK